MLKNIEDENPLNRQLSKKWLEGSKHIVSKVVDPIYKIMDTLTCERHLIDQVEELQNEEKKFDPVVVEEISGGDLKQEELTEKR